VLAVTHGPLARSELFGDVVRDEGHELIEWELPTQGRPAGNGWDAVIVLGGSMNVGEELEHPWLRDEYELLRGWVRDETPLLGVCLGGQTLAHAAGARVAPLPRPEVGFRPVELTDEGARDRVVGVLPRRFESLNGNNYAFEVPEGAVALATSPASPQAYRLGASAWGVQFHPEVRRDQVLAWWSRREWLPKPLEELERDLDEKLGAWQELGRGLCRAFLSAARERRLSG
jgi:GMP synthase-like glutamine amidotransferase